VLVKASMPQPAVAHNSANCRAIPALVRTRREASLRIFRWISILCPSR
jgi:hypothetical protein